MKLFNRDQMIANEIACDLEQHMDGWTIPQELTILDRSSSVVSAFLSEARAEKARLENEIAERQERLRQAVVTIDAFEPVLTKLDDGYDAKEDGRKSYEAAIEAKRKRKGKAALDALPE